MTLEQRLDQLLNELQATEGATDQRRLSVPLERGALTCRFSTVDQLSCALEELSYSAPHLSDLAADELQQLGTALCERLHYLLEPLQTIEIDRQEAVVQCRSAPPARLEEGVQYYELVLQPGAIGLKRFEKPRGESRRAVPAVLTREALQRLVADLVAADAA